VITVNKIDFQGDDLLIYYTKPEDYQKQIKQRMLVVAWRNNADIMGMLNKLFQAVVDRYIAKEDGKEDINWKEFETELKKYEEKNKK
jgi:ATP-dependent exoDNAse (exonuclease V) beta subunit